MALFHDEYTCYSFSFYIKTVHIISYSRKPCKSGIRCPICMLSEFQKRKMVEYGWPEEKIVVKGNSVGRVERVDRAEWGTGAGLSSLRYTLTGMQKMPL